MVMTLLESLLFTAAVLSGIWIMANMWETLGEEHCEDKQCDNNRRLMNDIAHRKFYEEHSLVSKPNTIYFH